MIIFLDNTIHCSHDELSLAEIFSLTENSIKTINSSPVVYVNTSMDPVFDFQTSEKRN